MMDLKPCPFCGGEAVMKSYLTAGGVFTRDNEHVFITCKSCGARSDVWSMSIRYSALEKAEEAWNKRTEAAPTVEERHTGKWEIADLPEGKMKYCSECGYGQFMADIREYNFCPNCGARMEESDE